jgi:two-component sensor histidine kinase
VNANATGPLPAYQATSMSPGAPAVSASGIAVARGGAVGGPENDSPDDGASPGGGAGTRHVSLRRNLVFLIIVALLPIMVLAVLQGLVRLETRRSAEIDQLSTHAGALADTNRTILDSAAVLLRAIAANPLIGKGGRGCADTLTELKAASPAYANLVAYDADGWLRCAAVGPGQPYQVQDRTWWNRLRAADHALVSDAKWGAFTHTRVMLVALPTYDAAGVFDGAVAASLDLGWLDMRLRTRVRGETAVAVLSDSGQTVMANRPLPPIELATPAGRTARSRDAAGVGWTYIVVPLVARATHQNGLFVVYASRDVPRFALAWWQTVVDFLLPVLAILIASAAIWFGTQRLVLRWLIALQRLSLHFAAGDYRHRSIGFARAPLEIRGVVASLYRMSNAVAERDRRLRLSLEHQRRLAREVHHRVKNNFQVVMSLLSLQSSRLPEGDARYAIDQARRRIGALALVHRLVYDSGEIASISSRTLLAALCEQLKPADVPDRRIVLDCKFDDVPLDIDSAVPLTLWLVETVHNAVTHGFDGRGAGQVTTQFDASGGRATLTVSDDGIGFDPAAAHDNRPGAYGLRLIRALAAQLGGNAEVVPRPGGGSIATLNFPLRALNPPLQPAET